MNKFFFFLSHLNPSFIYELFHNRNEWRTFNVSWTQRHANDLIGLETIRKAILPGKRWTTKRICINEWMNRIGEEKRSKWKSRNQPKELTRWNSKFFLFVRFSFGVSVLMRLHQRWICGMQLRCPAKKINKQDQLINEHKWLSNKFIWCVLVAHATTLMDFAAINIDMSYNLYFGDLTFFGSFFLLPVKISE